MPSPQISSIDFLALLSEMVIITDSKNNVIYINRAAEEFFECQSSNIIGENYIYLSEKYSYPPLRDIEISNNDKSNSKNENIYTLLMPSGIKKLASWKIIPHQNPYLSRQNAYWLVGYDLTRKKQSQQEIEPLKHLFQEVLDSVESKHWSKDKNGIYTVANAAFLRAVGLNTVDEILGKTDYEAPWAETAEQLLINDAEVMESGHAQVYEENVRSELGTSLTFLVKKIPWKNNKGEIVGTIGSSIDITSLKKSEAAAKQALSIAARAKDDAEFQAARGKMLTLLSGSLAHDLRTLISVIEQNGKIISDFWHPLIDAYKQAKSANLPIKNIDSVKVEKLLLVGKNIVDVSRDMQDFVNSTLQFIRFLLSNGLPNQNFTLCQMQNCVDNALKHYLNKESHQEIFTVEKVNFPFIGDEILIVRVLSNLIDNALREIKAHEKGRIIIYSEITENESHLIFRDTVGNLQSHTADNIFETSLNTSSASSGIGLAFCKLVMTGSGGDIVCHAEYGNYVEFKLIFPKVLEKIPLTNPAVSHKQEITSA